MKQKITTIVKGVWSKQPNYVFYFLSFLRGVPFGMVGSVYVLLLFSKGLSPLQVTLIGFIFMGSNFIFQVPTGALADAWGRKKMYILGLFFQTLSFFIYGVGQNFFAFIIAEILFGIGFASMTGAMDAWVVDKIFGKFGKIRIDFLFSRSEVSFSLAMILGAILTVFLSKLGLQFPFIIGALLFLLQLILGQIFLEEKILKKHKQSLKLGFAKTYKTIKQGISYSVGLPAIGLMVLFSSLYVMAIKGLDIFWAKRFVDISGTESVTALWVVMMIFLSLGSFAVKHWAQKGKGQIEGLLLTTILTAIFIFISTISPFFYPAAAFFVFYEFCRGTYRPLQTAYLNHHCQTGIRATVLSFNAMASSFGGMIGLLLAGFLATTFSINISWYVICLIFGLALLPLFKLSQLKFSIKR